jgi:hypothetical protein
MMIFHDQHSHVILSEAKNLLWVGDSPLMRQNRVIEP